MSEVFGDKPIRRKIPKAILNDVWIILKEDTISVFPKTTFYPEIVEKESQQAKNSKYRYYVMYADKDTVIFESMDNQLITRIAILFHSKASKKEFFVTNNFTIAPKRIFVTDEVIWENKLFFGSDSYTFEVLEENKHFPQSIQKMLSSCDKERLLYIKADSEKVIAHSILSKKKEKEENKHSNILYKTIKKLRKMGSDSTSN